jgi:hypothetical protein
MFKKRHKKQEPVIVVPRLAIVHALARAAFDGDEAACAAARRLLAAIDESPNEYIAV